jgi:hypothetical protein
MKAKTAWLISKLNANGANIVRLYAVFAICLLSYFEGLSQLKDCKDCDIPSFQSVTMYYIAQPHSSFGFGMEAGTWNRSESRFSYFLGARMQWFRLDPNSAKFNNVADNVRFSLYVKGQARIVNRFYLEVSPMFVNLTSIDAAVGLRYSYPLSDVIGIGIEPTYSIVQKEYALNANIHFAL